MTPLLTLLLVQLLPTHSPGNYQNSYRKIALKKIIPFNQFNFLLMTITDYFQLKIYPQKSPSARQVTAQYTSFLKEILRWFAPEKANHRSEKLKRKTLSVKQILTTVHQISFPVPLQVLLILNWNYFFRKKIVLNIFFKVLQSDIYSNVSDSAWSGNHSFNPPPLPSPRIQKMRSNVSESYRSNVSDSFRSNVSESFSNQWEQKEVHSGNYTPTNTVTGYKKSPRTNSQTWSDQHSFSNAVKDHQMSDNQVHKSCSCYLKIFKDIFVLRFLKYWGDY